MDDGKAAFGIVAFSLLVYVGLVLLIGGGIFFLINKGLDNCL